MKGKLVFVDTGARIGEGFKAAPVFEVLANVLKEDGAEYVKKIQGVFAIKVTKGGETVTWIVDAKNGNGSVKIGEGKGDVTLTLSDDDFFQLLLGKLNPQTAFFQGKVKFAGNIGLALKLQQVQRDLKAKL